MADKKAKTKKKTKNPELYYFYSVGCGFCKRVDPIVDELIKEGHNILKLDTAEPDNQGLNRELQQKYGKQCGTPWFIDPETGNDVCGFREKDILEKWAKGEEIPPPPRPTGPPPKVPFHGADEKEVNAWKKEYASWKEENKHLPNLQEAEQILGRPRPKSDPPRPPMVGASDEEFDKWSKTWEDWRSDNSHLPNVQTSEQIITRIKSQGQQAPGAPQAPISNTGIANVESKVSTVEAKLQALEVKVDKIMSHFGVK